MVKKLTIICLFCSLCLFLCLVFVRPVNAATPVYGSSLSFENSFYKTNYADIDRFGRWCSVSDADVPFIENSYAINNNNFVSDYYYSYDTASSASTTPYDVEFIFYDLKNNSPIYSLYNANGLSFSSYGLSKITIGVVSNSQFDLALNNSFTDDFANLQHKYFINVSIPTNPVVIQTINFSDYVPDGFMFNYLHLEWNFPNEREYNTLFRSTNKFSILKFDNIENAFNAGYNQAKNDMQSQLDSQYQSGYTNGFKAAEELFSNDIKDMFLGVAGVPFQVFTDFFQPLNINILGFSLGSLVLSLITLGVLIFIIKKVFF